MDSMRYWYIDLSASSSVFWLSSEAFLAASELREAYSELVPAVAAVSYLELPIDKRTDFRSESSPSLSLTTLSLILVACFKKATGPPSPDPDAWSITCEL